ncbi:MAG: hypothetical protein NVSMB62_14580 [Acidobacteriaceae bacterium]
MNARTLAITTALLASCSSLFANAKTCVISPDDRNKVVEAVRALYVDDLQAFHAVITSDFYIYDAGRRYDGDAIMQAAKS